LSHMHDACQRAQEICASLRNALGSRIADLADVLSEAVLPVNRFTRRKPALAGSTIHIPSLIRFVLSNYQYRRFMLKRMAGGKHEYKISIVIDVSSSLMGQPSACNFESAFVLIEALMLLGITTFSIITFGRDVSLVKTEEQPWDAKAMYQLLQYGLVTNHSSASMDASAITWATSLLQKSSARGGSHMFVFSDGYGSEGSLVTAALHRAQNAGIRVLAMCFGLEETGLKDTYSDWIQCSIPQVLPDALRSWCSDRACNSQRLDFVTEVVHDSTSRSIDEIWRAHESIFTNLMHNLDEERGILVDVQLEGARNLNVDLCIAMDCTGSMGAWIQAAKDRAHAIVEAVKQRINSETGFTAQFSLGFIAYRDHCDGDMRLNTKPLTTDVATVTTFISEQKATGGGDTPEDIAGAIDAAYRLNWSNNSTKIFVVISDSPCHGTKYQASPQTLDDTYPHGDPHGIVPEDVLYRMAEEKGIQVAGVICGDYPSLKPHMLSMWNAFKTKYDTNTKGLQLKIEDVRNDISLLDETLSEFVMRGVFDFL
jgi:hypothetical protein